MIAQDPSAEAVNAVADEPAPRAFADDDTRRIIAMVSLLSLDVVRPFYGAMGVVLSDPDHFQTALRELMVRGRQQFRKTKTLIELMPAIRHIIAERDGEERSAEFQRWFDHLYFDLPSHQRQWSWWSDAFERGLAQGDRAPEKPLLSSKRACLMYRELMDLGELQIQAKALKADALSDWDLEIYVRRCFDHDDFLMDDPFNCAFAVVRIARLQVFARGLCGTLSPDKQQALHKRARRLVAVLDPIEPLQPLARLPIGQMSSL
jgi:hypothetical protein